MPEDNDLSKKIDDAGAALDSKRTADDYYNVGKYIEAKNKKATKTATITAVGNALNKALDGLPKK